MFKSDVFNLGGGIHNEDVPLDSIVIPILVAAQCYWMRNFLEFLPLCRNKLTTSLCIVPRL